MPASANALMFAACTLPEPTSSNRFPSTAGSSNARTLRAAIEEANAVAGADTIHFNIPITETGYSASPLAFTISPASALPNITDPVTIDGTTQPDFTGTPIIEINGAAAGLGADGLAVSAGSNEIRGLVVNRFDGNGIELSGAGSNTIVGNYVGTDVTGTLDRGNDEKGIRISGVADNTVGGSTSPDRNVISGNGLDGIGVIGVRATGNVIVGNYIGTDAAGTGALGSSDDGVEIREGASNNTVGGTTPGERNMLSSNEDGLEIEAGSGSGNVVQGNFVGTDVSGTLPLPNVWNGIHFHDGPVNNLIGGHFAGRRKSDRSQRTGRNRIRDWRHCRERHSRQCHPFQQ